MTTKTQRRKNARKQYMAGRVYEARVYSTANCPLVRPSVELVDRNDVGKALYQADVCSQYVGHAGLWSHAMAMALARAAAMNTHKED